MVWQHTLYKENNYNEFFKTQHARFFWKESFPGFHWYIVTLVQTAVFFSFSFTLSVRVNLNSLPPPTLSVQVFHFSSFHILFGKCLNKANWIFLHGKWAVSSSSSFKQEQKLLRYLSPHPFFLFFANFQKRSYLNKNVNVFHGAHTKVWKLWFLFKTAQRFGAYRLSQWIQTFKRCNMVALTKGLIFNFSCFFILLLLQCHHFHLPLKISWNIRRLYQMYVSLM